MKRIDFNELVNTFAGHQLAAIAPLSVVSEVLDDEEDEEDDYEDPMDRYEGHDYDAEAKYAGMD